MVQIIGLQFGSRVCPSKWEDFQYLNCSVSDPFQSPSCLKSSQCHLKIIPKSYQIKDNPIVMKIFSDLKLDKDDLVSKLQRNFRISPQQQLFVFTLFYLPSLINNSNEISLVNSTPPTISVLCKTQVLGGVLFCPLYNQLCNHDQMLERFPFVLQSFIGDAQRQQTSGHDPICLWLFVPVFIKTKRYHKTKMKIQIVGAKGKVVSVHIYCASF